ncbi:ABC transporter ATP-binding protein [Clostridium sp. E02]|uniref:ABC transporter ATP-binding protein n=1 Tax=Clostridium sp. E02 TaxID=2487134 RepID=UPI000F52A305|nr:ABC transporter ATP-binding protein [Clostridium sp. E02]
MDKENKTLTFQGIIITLKKIPKTLRLLWSIDPKDTVIIVGFHVIIGIFPILTVLLSQALINNLVKEGASLNIVLAVFLTYMVATLLSELFAQFSGYFQNLFQFDIQYKLKYKMMEQCALLSLEDFEDPQTYDSVEKLMGEVTYKPYQMFTAIIGIISSSITMVSSIILIFSWHPIFAVFLLFTPLASILYFLRIGQSEFIMMWDRAKDERKSWYLSYLTTHDFSFKEMNLFGTKPYFMEQYWKISEKFILQNKQILKRKTVFNVIYEIVLQGISVFIIGVSVMEAFYKKIQVGNVLSYIRGVSLIQNNSQSIMECIYIAYNCTLYMEQLYAFLEEKKPMKREELLTSLKGEVKEIRLENLTFRYKSSKTDDALKGVSLQIKKGDHIAIVGKNGSGKSTIAKMIAGLYPVSKGQFFINQIDITDLDIDQYKQKISVLFQDFVKYEMPVRENIGLSKVEDLENLDKMRQIASQVGLDFLETDGTLNLSMQLGSWFDEGRQLSQGQWQKVALCRTFFRDASVYILDEPNSALDPVSEKIILDLFFLLTRDQIGIFISHKINAAKLADRIVVMDDGRIVGTGTHDSLMKNCSQYRDLYYAENYTQEEKAEEV